ncbi:hypothetical protein CCACVL1_24843 [Corchorus capsularis]|uniref:Uncharacterized protein n=1 Tax=Corchorus capsularis TaxID=210143 RepID=A0A1R3GMW9_COCAP|nr:hypothetical protein CCACVL1_24843 [Corchorus capsularis]
MASRLTIDCTILMVDFINLSTESIEIDR